MPHKHPLYNRYNSARNRCNNPNSIAYKNYGGRGIKFEFNSFEEYLNCLGDCPGSGFTVDRIDNDGPYSPTNIRWASRKEQERNKRERVDSNYWGVSKHSDGNWQARISINGKRIHLGYSESFGNTLALLLLYKENLNAISKERCSPV